MAKQVTLVEVGLRDGLQNEAVFVNASTKVELGKKLVAAGVKRMELGAFVSPKWVPQMAGSEEVANSLLSYAGKRGDGFSVLVPNEVGMQAAMKTKVKEVAIFAACSESFSIKNINCTMQESFERFKPVLALAKKNKIKVRGYLSTVFGCPFEGDVDPKVVLKNIEKMFELGCYEISLGDTVGIADPKQVQDLLKKILKKYPVKYFAGHFHDTRGTALANIFASLQMGIKVFDSSVGGLGGCPYAPSATGNIATEDVVYMFDRMGIRTGINLQKLVETSLWMAGQMNKEMPSKVSKAHGEMVPKGKVKKH